MLEAFHPGDNSGDTGAGGMEDTVLNTVMLGEDPYLLHRDFYTPVDNHDDSLGDGGLDMVDEAF